MKSKITVLLILMCSFSWSQIVSTISEGTITDGLAVDAEGNVYGSDFSGSEVFKVDSDGNVSVFADGFTNPNGIGVSEAGIVNICDFGAGRICRFETDGTPLDTLSGLTTPTGIKRIPGTNDLFMVQYGADRASIIHEDGEIEEVHSGFPLSGPAGIATIGDTIYIANFDDRKILKYYDGELEWLVTLPSHPGGFNSIGFLTAFGGTLYATHISGNRIYAINPSTGEYAVYAGDGTSGETDGALTVALFDQPNGIVADEAHDRLYISDLGTENLRVIEGVTLSIEENKIYSPDFEYKLQGNTLTVTFNGVASTNKTRLELIDSAGKVWKYMEASNAGEASLIMTVDCSDLSSGMYILSVKQNGRMAPTEKILISN